MSSFSRAMRSHSGTPGSGAENAERKRHFDTHEYQIGKDGVDRLVRKPLTLLERLMVKAGHMESPPKPKRRGRPPKVAVQIIERGREPEDLV